MANLKKINVAGTEYGLGITTSEVRADLKPELDKLTGIAAGAQVNVIEAVKLNGKTLSVVNKSVDIVLDVEVFKVMEALPAAPAAGDEKRIHVVPATSTEEGNSYSEYIWTGTKWEKLGTFKADVDLSSYAKTAYVNGELAKKVDKVTGKGLSTNDYTTAEKNKLAGLENYQHPASHPATMITESADKRFMKDAERTKLAGVSAGANKVTFSVSGEVLTITEE